MTIEPSVTSKRSGLAILWDTIVAPLTAFSSLRLEPRWLVALIATLAVATLGSVLAVPASEHIAATMFPKMIAENPSLAGLSADKQREALANLQSVYVFLPLITPVVTALALLTAGAVIFVAALVAKSKISYRLAFALACNIGFVYYGLFNLVVGIMAVLRGPETYGTQIDLFTAIPCLAWAVPGAAPKLVAFLALVNPFTIWAFALNVAGLRTAAGMGTIAAAVVASLFFLATALSVVAGAQ